MTVVDQQHSPKPVLLLLMSVGSSSSLSRYAIARSPTIDPYNGNPSRDFCNSFWGAGDAGVNILFARMRGAARTTDDLRNFWKQRSIIEEQYSNSLSELAKMSIGKDEIGLDARLIFGFQFTHKYTVENSATLSTLSNSKRPKLRQHTLTCPHKYIRNLRHRQRRS